MEVINKNFFNEISGGIKWQGYRASINVIDLRGKNMGSWIDAANTCWKPRTPSAIMYPSGIYIPNFRF